MLLPPIVYPSLQLLLVNRLQKAIEAQDNPLESTQPNGFDTQDSSFESTQPNGLALLDNLPQNLAISGQTTGLRIPLHRVQEDQQLCYVSAIALKLANLRAGNYWQQSALNIALDIAKRLATASCRMIPSASVLIEPLPLDRVWQYFAVQVSPSGWIEFHLNHQGQAAWLQLLVDQLPTLGEHHSNHTNCLTLKADRNSTSIIKTLYTYSRCSALLRLAAQEGIISDNPAIQSSSTPFCITEPNPLPWLTSNYRLRCQHPTESRLVSRVATVLDCLSCPSKPLTDGQISKLAQALSQDFQSFHAACRIWGEVKREELALSQVRLGLVAITQALLRSLLQDWLGLEPPTEL